MVSDGILAGKHCVEYLEHLLVQSDGKGCEEEVRTSRTSEDKEESIGLSHFHSRRGVSCLRWESLSYTAIYMSHYCCWVHVTKKTFKQPCDLRFEAL